MMPEGFGDFKVVVVTPPANVDSEQMKIAELLEAGVSFVHLRKPDFSRRRLAEYISLIPEKYRKRIKLHSHFDLCEEFGLGGIHLNSRNPEIVGNPASVSKSCHDIAELDSPDSPPSTLDYVTLSPVFDSISKTGYISKFKPEELKPALVGKRVVALGGVTPDKFELLRETGFIGAALLGYIWNDNFHNNLKTLKTEIDRICCNI